jgi:hypothetical protein
MQCIIGSVKYLKPGGLAGWLVKVWFLGGIARDGKWQGIGSLAELNFHRLL